MLQTQKSKTFVLIILISLIINTGSCKKEEEAQLINFNRSVTYGTMKDQEGNTYKTVIIGTQTWMAENLRTTKFRNGDSIPVITDHNEWIDLTTSAYCNYRNDKSKVTTYGRLYNWYAVNDSNKIAPEGWHVASNEEWSILINYLDGDTLAVAKLKEEGNTHWFDYLEPNNATNESGFTALPCGFRHDITFNETFYGLGFSAMWWSSTSNNSTSSWSLGIFSEDSTIKRSANNNTFGYSVRCIKD